MPVTMTTEECGKLRAIYEIHYQANHAQGYYAALYGANEEYFGGLRRSNYRDAWPDWLLLKMCREHCIGTACSGRADAGPGEGTIDGLTYEECIQQGRSPIAELHPVSRGTLAGKIVLELARRLEEYIKEDRRIREAAPWEPPEELPGDSTAAE